MIHKILKKSINFLKFTISSGLGVMVNLAITFILAEYFFGRINYFYAYLIGLTIGLIVQFIMHINYTFNKKDKIKKRFAIFVIISIVISIIQAYLVKNITNIVGVDYYLLVIIIVIGVFYVSNYFISKYITFK